MKLNKWNGKLKVYLFASLIMISLSSCTYLKYASVQSEYARIQNAEPAQLNLKHMIDIDKYYVVGSVLEKDCDCAESPLSIVAYSNRYKQHERVDSINFVNINTHYGLTMPEGQYELLVFADLNSNDLLEKGEVVGRIQIQLDASTAPNGVLTHVNIELDAPVTVDWVEEIHLPKSEEFQQSIFFPSGTVRSLDDPIFDKGIVTLGMYDPASFAEYAPTMFYALEEDFSYKIPVIFVHGIDGSPRDFLKFVNGMDHSRYKAWFYYYPSGGDLDLSAELLYHVFLSGEVIPHSEQPVIIVAHSMGGLVARKALNLYRGEDVENRVELFVSIASPFGGHKAAAEGEENGLIVLPAWRDLNPNNDFITSLYDKPLSSNINHQLLYAYKNNSSFKLGENSDGVVSLDSQLYSKAQQQSDEQFGFNHTHTGVLNSEQVVDYVKQKMDLVENIFPDSHLKLLDQGGFEVALNDKYDPVTKYVITKMGRYVVALVKGELVPFHQDQRQFIQAAKGSIAPSTDLEKGWLRFIEEYPELN
ncbi:MAG: DUF413 domain-containing protein [Aliivibrio sp.]|uniref:DUF413 domain-containing protein n=1 Tax=Aliivibrio sp. TaxID=1872443 RepID=UPI001A464270|nr:DUF413 domain-containing protein [Aliivibrio sp.]